MKPLITPGPAAAFAVCSLACAIAPVQAGEAARKSYDIAAGDAVSTLKRFADLSGRQVVFLVDAVRGVTTNAVRGEYTVREALTRLVADTGLGVAEDAKSGALMVNRLASHEPPSSQPTTKSTTQPMKSPRTLLAVLATWMAAATSTEAQTAPPVGAAKAAEEPTVLSVFTVNEATNVGYASMQTTSGMRTVQELKNVANSISVLNSELIADIGATNLAEVSKYFVSGEESQSPAGFQVTVHRGISTGSGSLRNGWIWYSPQDTYVMERVELLRGPNAFLYGEAALGGGSNQITKRGLFTRDFNRIKVTGGGGGPSSDVSLSNNNLRRVELDFNRVIKPNLLAVRVASVASSGTGWDDNASSRVRGIYGAVTYRPFRSTQIDVMVERTLTTNVRAQGLFTDQFSYTTRTTLTNANGLVYIPATGQVYRATGQVRSAGSGLTIVDPTIVPRGFQVTGPNNTHRDNFNSFSIEVAQKIGKNLNLLLSGNAYQRKTDLYGQAVGAAVYRDLSPLLPNGAANPNFNRLYTEYQRTDVFSGNIVRDMRLSAVYDLTTPWMKQQIVANLQQHQDTPKAQSGAKFGEYIDPTNPNFVGTIDSAVSLAANTTSRATLTNNRFFRRYYLGDGNSGRFTGEMTGRPGVSTWFPDLGGAVGASNATFRRFYTPSVGVGASGSYFNDHLFTLVGFRQDHFNMRTEWGVVQAAPGYTWNNNYIPGQTQPTPQFYNVKADGSNYGAVLRINSMVAFSWNRGKSFQMSVGDGSGLFTPGQVQTIPRGQGQDASIRLTFLGGRLEVNTTYYDNFQPNARISPAPNVAIQDELTAIFGSGFNRAGTDYQTLKTKGYELELVANFTRNWRLMLNASTNKLALTERLPQLKGFQGAAKGQSKATPLLDAFLLTFPDGVPSGGYTKTRANLLTRYDFRQGALKGFYLGGGANWRQPTFRGNAVLVQGGTAQALWSPSYTVVNLLAGYRTKLAERPVTFALNVDNALNKEYYVSGSANIGRWGPPQNFRFSSTVEF